LGDLDYHHGTNGKISGTVYHNDAQLQELAQETTKYFGLTNPLHPDVFKGLRKMEAEVVSMVVDLFHGRPTGSGASCSAVGCVTSGGTESILLACKAYRDWARETRGVLRPNMYRTHVIRVGLVPMSFLHFP
jgi:sphinganine-1-phosphate aldolase